MAEAIADTETADNAKSQAQAETDQTGKAKKREIKGGLPYSVYPNAFKKALEGIIAAERPDRFSNDFLGTVLKVSGGSGRPVGPLLKKMQFIASDGTPTELYSKFKTESGRGQAALDGLRNSFGELFRRNEFIHRADTAKVKDLVVEITGLNKNDNITRLITQTFEVIRGFADRDGAPSGEPSSLRSSAERDEEGALEEDSVGNRRGSRLGLSYHINVVLPETENIVVFNAIFRSLRENLLRDL